MNFTPINIPQNTSDSPSTTPFSPISLKRKKIILTGVGFIVLVLGITLFYINYPHSTKKQALQFCGACPPNFQCTPKEPTGSPREAWCKKKNDFCFECRYYGGKLEFIGCVNGKWQTGCREGTTPTPLPKPSPTPTPLPKPSPTPTPLPKPSPTPTITPSPTPAYCKVPEQVVGLKIYCPLCK